MDSPYRPFRSTSIHFSKAEAEEFVAKLSVHMNSRFVEPKTPNDAGYCRLYSHPTRRYVAWLMEHGYGLNGEGEVCLLSDHGLM